MLVFLLSSFYFTKEYQFGASNVEVLTTARYGSGFMYSLDVGGVPTIMSTDSLGNVVEVAVPSDTASHIRGIEPQDSMIWINTGNMLLVASWPNSANGADFGNDTVVAFLPLTGSNALALLNAPSSNRYRVVKITGGSFVSDAANIGNLGPDNGYAFGDMELISSTVLILTFLVDESNLYVASMNTNLSSLGFVKRIEFSSVNVYPGGVYLDVLPDGKIVVAYTVDSASYTRWAYTLLTPDGNHIRTVMFYPVSSAISHHYVSGVKVIDNDKFAIFGSLSNPITRGGVVVVDTSGNVVYSYTFTSTLYLRGVFATSSGYAFLGKGSTATGVKFLKQLPSFGPCDTSSVDLQAVPVSVSTYGTSVSLSTVSPMYTTAYFTFSSASSPTVSVTCSTSVVVSDTISPTVNNTYPPDGATGIPETATVWVAFSEPVNPATFNTSTVSITPTVSFTTSCTAPDTCVINHSPFPNDTLVTISLSSGITDTAGNGLVPYTFSFRTASPLPPGSLFVVLTSPDSGEINVPLNANIGVWFSDEVDTSTVNGSSVSIRGWDGSSVRYYSFSVTCPTNLFCVLDPSPLFRPSEIVTVEFTSGINDRSGTVPLTPKVITFRTQEVDTLRPVVVFTVPDSGAIGVPTNTNVGVQFSRDMDTTTLSGNIVITGSISGSHGYFYSCPTPDYCTLDPYPDFTAGEEVSVEFTDGILDEEGRRLVPKTVTFTVGSGQDNTPPTVYIISPANDTVALYNAGDIVRAHVSDPGGIQRVDWVLLDQTYSKPTNCNGSLYGDPDTSCFAMPGVPTGVYLLKAFAYDRSNNVGYDSVWVSFNDTVPPYLLLTEPSDGDAGVSPNTDVRLVFSEDMDTSTFGSVRISVGSTTYAYSHVWESLSILRINPSSPFPYDSTVRVKVDSFADLSGNLMLPDSFSFRVISNASVSVRILSVSPDTVYVGSGDSVEVVGVVLSTYPITGAEVILDGDVNLSMLALDGAYDEVEETVAVKLYTEREGVHTVVIRGYNAYDSGTSPEARFYVLRVPFLSRDNVVVYPNPAKGQAKVRFVLGDDALATVEVFDLKARKVFSTSRMFEGFRTHVINLPSLPPGLYLLRIRARDQKVEMWFSVVR